VSVTIGARFSVFRSEWLDIRYQNRITVRSCEEQHRFGQTSRWTCAERERTRGCEG
jgi:hypothetical protein